jgi:NAD(P)-dependent dehydrogenase (short-subunit alcohol dehydrogenase family)
MDFKNKTVVVTGGASGIGKTICAEFAKYGAKVCIIDLKENDYFIGDLADEKTLHSFVEKVLHDYQGIDYLINNAMLTKGGIMDCSYADFDYTLKVGVAAPFMLAKLFLNHFNKGASIVNISSTRARMSQPNTESYTAAKGGIASLTHALAISLAGKVRVNSVSPGWIDTSFKTYEGPDADQHPVKRVGDPLDIANMVLYLCSDKASFITGQDFCIDGGMTKQMIYNDDFGWTYEK